MIGANRSLRRYLRCAWITAVETYHRKHRNRTEQTEQFCNKTQTRRCLVLLGNSRLSAYLREKTLSARTWFDCSYHFFPRVRLLLYFKCVWQYKTGKVIAAVSSFNLFLWSNRVNIIEVHNWLECFTST